MIVTAETVRRLALSPLMQAALRDQCHGASQRWYLARSIGLRTLIALRTRQLCLPVFGSPDYLTELGAAVRQYLIRQERSR